MSKEAIQAEQRHQNSVNKGLSEILQHRAATPQPVTTVASAFGFLEGARDQANALEFRFRDGNSIWFSYHWLGTWRFNPSEGLLLKFTGDLTYLALLRGSNLDRPLHSGAIHLLRGLQERRVVWIRELTESEIAQAGESEPTIDRIEVAELESHEEARAWIEKTAPAFR